MRPSRPASAARRACFASHWNERKNPGCGPFLQPLRCAGRVPAHQGQHPGAPLTIANRFMKRSVVAGAGAMLAALPARADWNLINMPEGVSELSREIYDMHMIMFWICTVIAVVHLRRDDLRHDPLPEVEGRGRRPQAPAQRAARGRLDDRPGHHPDRDGDPLGREAGQDRGHLRLRPHGQGHRPPVVLAVRVPRHGRVFLQPARAHQRPRAAERLGHRPAKRRELPARSRQAARDPDRRQGAPAPDRERRDPRLVGAGLRHEARRGPRLHQRDVDLGGRGQAGHLPRPVRGAVRRRPWLHAGRRRSEARRRNSTAWLEEQKTAATAALAATE